MSRETIKASFRVDSGANMFVGNRSKYFSRLIKKRIGVELDTAAQGHFEGVGVITVSAPQLPDCLILLYPTFLAPNEECCTVSNGALIKYAGFKKAVIDTHNQLELTFNDGKELAIPFIQSYNKISSTS